MCRGAPALGPLRSSRTGPGLLSPGLDTVSVQPIHIHPYLQSEATSIEDALARAQAEAAMWRANFEKAQRAAQETTARFSELISRGDVGKPTSLLPDAFTRPRQGPGAPDQDARLRPPLQTSSLPGFKAEDVWMVPPDGVDGEQQPQGSSNKSGIPATPSMPWGLSGVFDDTDSISFKDIAAGLSDLNFPATSASLGPASSEVTSPLLTSTAFTTAPATVAESTGPFPSDYEAPIPPSSRAPFTSSAEVVPLFQQTGGFPAAVTSGMTAVNAGAKWSPRPPPVYSTAVVFSPPQHDFSRQAGHFGPPQEEASGLVPDGHDGQPFQHPGVATVRRARQQSARSRNVGSGCSPVAAAALEVAEEARGRKEKRAKREPESQSPAGRSPGGATRRCMSPGCTRRPSYGFSPGAKNGDKGGARWCRAHAAEGMEDLRNLRCSHVGRGGVPCRAQPSYGYAGDKRPTRCRAHAEEGMENVRMPRCQHPGGCKRQPLYGVVGADRKPTRCRAHALPGMKDLRGAMCHGADGSCTKRPSYGFRGDPRPTRCGSHKEVGMEDLISARCNYPDCRTVASYGVQAEGTHVIRRTRCKAHRTPEMTCGTKGPGCMVPGGCETRPSYGWPDKFDGEHPPRPERCKKHSLPGMEYMGSAARARKKRLLLETKEEPAPPAPRPVAPRVRSPVAKPVYYAPTPRVRPTRKCVAAAAPIIDPEDDDDLEALVEQADNVARGWSPESRMQGEAHSPEAAREGARLAASVREAARKLEEARAERSRTLQEMENLGDLHALQELKEIEDQANDQIWGSGRPDSPELAGMSAFDKDFSSDWARPESPDSGGIMDVDYIDTACS